MNEKKEKTPPNPAKAVFKLLIYFKDGKSRTFYNYHTCYNSIEKKVIVDENIGLKKLENLILHKFAGQYKTALIYYIPKDTQIIKYVFNNKVFNAPYTFNFDKSDTSIRITLK